MVKRSVIIILSVVAGAAVAAGLGVLIWWLVTSTEPEEVVIIELEGDGFGNVRHTAAFTRIPAAGDLFWWFYPTTAASATTKPLLLWLDGVTGLPPSLLANFGMFGPFDFNLNARPNSWVDGFNLLFVDAPLGTGFSTLVSENSIPSTLEENALYLTHALESFYKLQPTYKNTPLYIIGEGSGASLAVSLTAHLSNISTSDTCNVEDDEFCFNLTGVFIGNGIISPALALTKLGVYLEEWAYIDGDGRQAIETLSTTVSTSVNAGQYEDALNSFLSLNGYVNDYAGAVAVNLGHIVQRLMNTTNSRDYFGQRSHLQVTLPEDISTFMDSTVAYALGIESSSFDSRRSEAIEAVKDTFMIPIVDKVEYILQNTNIEVTIYNGNLDAVSNTPGQLEWVNNLQWSGRNDFINSPRQVLAYNGLIEGYFRETDRLTFYWINVAGLSVPFDNPVAMRCVLERETQT